MNLETRRAPSPWPSPELRTTKAGAHRDVASIRSRPPSRDDRRSKAQASPPLREPAQVRLRSRSPSDTSRVSLKAAACARRRSSLRRGTRSARSARSPSEVRTRRCSRYAADEVHAPGATASPGRFSAPNSATNARGCCGLRVRRHGLKPRCSGVRASPRRAAAASAVRSRCGSAVSSKPTRNLRTVADRRSGG